jgi:hypothetical protein
MADGGHRGTDHEGRGGEEMRVTKYYCDHCKKEVKDESDLHLVKMAVHHKQSCVASSDHHVCYECVYDNLKIPDYNTESLIVSSKRWHIERNFFMIIKRLFGKGEKQ